MSLLERGSAVEPISLLPRPVTPEEQRRFRPDGWVYLDGLWTDDFARALTDEAAAGWDRAELPTRGPRTPVAEMRRPKKQTPVAVGEVLSRLHFSLIGLVRALSGRLLVPTFSAYGYYEVDDEVLLHVDTDECEVTLLTNPLGQVGPLLVHPDMEGMTMDDLGGFESDPSWDRLAGVPVTYPRLGVTALRGHYVPHHRNAQPVPEVSAVTAICYRSLF